jgi:hypothetical protein
MQGEPQIVRLIHLGETEAALRLIRRSAQPDHDEDGDGDDDAFDPNYKTAGGWSLLHMAALGDAVDLVAALIDAGADLEAEDRGGLRPLHYAVSWDAQQTLAELVRRGASLNCTSKDQIFYLNKIIPVFVVGGRTPLHLAVDKVPPRVSCRVCRVSCVSCVVWAHSLRHRATTSARRCCWRQARTLL